MFYSLQITFITYMNCLNSSIKKLLHDNVTKTYKKGLPKLENPIKLEAKNIVKLIKIETTSSI